MMHLDLSFDLGGGAGTCAVHIEDLEPDRLSDDARVLLCRLLAVCLEHHITDERLAEPVAAGVGPMAEPTRPGEISYSVRLAELAGHVERHAAALFDHGAGIAPLTDTDRAGHCLAELAYSAAAAERALSGRWVVACEALDAGASHGQVADAMGLDVEELCVGLRSWARSQRQQGLIDNATHDQVLALVGGSGRQPDRGAG